MTRARVNVPARIHARLAGTSSGSPGESYSTEEVAARLATRRDPADLVARTGIASRNWADDVTTASEMGANALAAALDDAGMQASELHRIIYVSSLGGDLRFPATANAVADRLGLAGSCDCYDLNNACMGFLSAYDIAARAVATGMGPVGIAVVEDPSRYISPADPRPYLVFGDAWAGAVVTGTAQDEGIVAVRLRNRGDLAGQVSLAHVAPEGGSDTIRFGDQNRGMTETAIAMVCECADEVLDETGLAIEDVDWTLLHQPNGRLFDAMVAALAAPVERTIPIATSLGSVGAASIPVSLDQLRGTGRTRPGDLVLMAGVGAGVSYGAMLVKLGEGGP